MTQLRRALCRYPFEPDEAPPEIATTSAVLAGPAADDEEQVAASSDAALDRAPDAFDPATAPPRLDLRYTAGRFHLTYDAPADIGALVEQALLEAKDTLFHLSTPTDKTPPPPTEPRPARHHASLGEALALIAQRSLDAGAPPGHSRANRYRIYLHLDTAGHGWLHKRNALPPTLRDRILCDGIIQPVWETDGKPVNVGRTQRIVPARTRRLLEDRDRGCRFPGCLAMHHLEAHHLDHWINGGQTDTNRLIMLCPHHHDEHHRGTYIMTGDPTRPDGVTFTARDGTRVGPTFVRYAGPHPPPGTDPPGDPSAPYPPKQVAQQDGSTHPSRGFRPYPGPVNEKLHLSLVRFDPSPRPPRRTPSRPADAGSSPDADAGATSP